MVLDLRGGDSQDQVFLASDVTLLEDSVATNHATAMRNFSDCGYGMGVVVAIDASGSMRGAPLEAVRQSLYHFTSEVRPQDKVGVLTFADDSRWDVPVDSPPEQLQDRLKKIATRGHYTHLYDGLLDAMQAFNDSFPARRELTVISDGHDEGSHHNEAEVIAQAQQQGIVIDSVGVTRSDPRYLVSLQRIAEQTGGRFRKAASDQELQMLVSNALSRWKSTPVATFTAERLPGDGTRHGLGVRWESHNLTGETTFFTPLMPNETASFKKSPKLYWIGGTAAGFVLLAILVLLLRRKRAQPANAQPVPIVSQPRGDEPPPADYSFPSPTPATGSWDSETPVHRSPTEAENLVPASKKTRMVHLFEAGSANGEIGWLEAVSGVLEGKRFPVSRGEFWIGAAPDNQLRIDDETVSGRHACIRLENSVLMILDNNSTNGTRINEVLLRGGRRSINPGDLIQIGRSRFRLLAEDPGPTTKGNR